MGRKRTYEELEQRLKELEAQQSAQEKMAEIFEKFTNSSTEGLGIADLEGRLTYLNPALGRMLGGDPKDFVGTNVRDYYLKEDLPNLENNILPAVEMNVPQKVEIPLVSISGEKALVLQSIFLIHDGEGKPHYANVITDIAERKQAEEGLRRYREHLEELIVERTNDLRKANEELQREITQRKRTEDLIKIGKEYTEALIDTANVMVVGTDETGAVTVFNQTAECITGYTKEEILGKNWYETIVPRDTYPHVWKEFQRLQREKAITETFENPILTKEGEERTISWRNSVVKGVTGKTEAISYGIDITDQKRVEKALRDSEEKYRMLAENISDMIWTRDMDLRLTYMSPSDEKMRGYTVEEAMHQTLEENLTPDSYKVALAAFKEELALEKREDKVLSRTRTLELEQTRKNGSTLWTETKMSFLRDDKGQPIGILGVTRDISDRKEAEDRLRASELKFRSVFDLSPQAISLTEAETGKFIDVNDKWCEMTKLTKDAVIGRSSTELGLISKPDRENTLKELEKLGEVFRAQDSSNLNTLMFSRSILISGKGIIVNMFVDITERRRAEEEKKQLEDQLQQAQKMEAIGTLAGGIAHDFNNLLMGIQGHASLMSLDVGSDHPHAEHLKGIEEMVKRGADLTRQLLGFARRGKYEVKPTDLNDLILRSSQMFGRTKKEITIRTKYQQGIWPVAVDRGQIEQVLLNLYVNAWQAMPGGGSLYLQTDNVILDHKQTEPFGVAPGNYVKITITDTGEGMDEETQRRIFDPFFTTREIGKGTGLGLASAYGIIKNHDGFINVSSKKGAGTTFTICLPASENEIPKEEVVTKDMRTGTETVLLVDDEDIIIAVGKKILMSLGYTVMTAGTGKEALAIYQNNKDTIDMVILDMIMPQMSGGKTYDMLKETNATIKVLLASGYTINGEAKEILERGCDGFIQKPFNIGELSRKMREILDKK